MTFKRWHGPGLMIAKEGAQDGHTANVFISYRGQATKSPIEHVRRASSLENVAAGAWEAAIDEVIRAAKNDRVVDPAQLHPEEDVAADEEEPMTPVPNAATPIGFSSGPGFLPTGPGLSVPGVGLTTQEIAAAIQPTQHQSQSSLLSQPSSLPPPPQSVGHASTPATPASTTPLLERPDMTSTLGRAREYDETAGRGVKRVAEDQLTPVPPGDVTEDTPYPDPPPLEEKEAFEALTMTWEQLCNIAEHESNHPLLQLQALVEMDRREPLTVVETDHGSWDGRWAMVCERDWKILQQLGQQLPCGAHDVNAVQAARKEYQWSKMTPTQRHLWSEAAVTGWNAYVDNKAVRVLSMEESAKVYRDLTLRNELDRVMEPRFVLTDKHDGLRTESHPLPVKASSRLVVPGYIGTDQI